MNIAFSHVVNSAVEALRFIGTKLFGGSINGSQREPFYAFRSHLKCAREPLKEPPNNLVSINLRASMAEFTTCERTIFID
jgi:hypothetical protein